jgi:hypothetical protein
VKQKQIEFVVGHQAAGGPATADGALDVLMTAELAERHPFREDGRTRPRDGDESVNVALRQALTQRIAVGAVLESCFGPIETEFEKTEYQPAARPATRSPATWAYYNTEENLRFKGGSCGGSSFLVSRSILPIVYLQPKNPARFPTPDWKEGFFLECVYSAEPERNLR